MARPINHAARAAQRQTILNVSGELFAKQGFHQTGMAAICKAVSMSPGAFYRYFGSKAELIEGIVTAERAEALALLDSLQEASDVRAGLVEMLMMCAAEAQDKVAMALSLEVAAEAARNPIVRQMVERVYIEFMDRLVAVLVDAQRGGQLGAALDLPSVAAVLVATAEGLSVSMFVGQVDEDALRLRLHGLVVGLLGGRTL